MASAVERRVRRSRWFSPSVMPCERMRLWVALIRCPASLRLSITSSRTVFSSAMTEVYGHASSDHSVVGLLPYKRKQDGPLDELSVDLDQTRADGPVFVVAPDHGSQL